MTHSRRVKHKSRLRELTIRKAKRKATSYMIWDTVQRGLGLRVQPTGAKAWKCVYSRRGHPRWYNIGNADSISLADARLKAAEIMVAVAKGRDPAAEKKAERGAGTFAELANKYVEQHAKRHNKSWTQAAALVARHATPRWGKLQATTITRSDVKQMMARIEAPITANQTLAAVSAIFSWALKEELVAANPCKLVDRNPTRERERILADSELPLFWKAFDDAGLVASSALKTILLTGQRPGEVSGPAGNMPVLLAQPVSMIALATTGRNARTASPSNAHFTDKSAGPASDCRPLARRIAANRADLARTSNDCRVFRSDSRRCMGLRPTLKKASRRFPPPWSVEELDACFVVRQRRAEAGVCLFRGRPQIVGEAAHPR
jgi:Arm domain-containing DNA-binding protein/integrase-like protein